MSEPMPHSIPKVRINLARGLGSLIDHGTQYLKGQLNPGTHHFLDGAAQGLKRAVETHPGIPQGELTVVEAAERLGLLETPRRRRRA